MVILSTKLWMLDAGSLLRNTLTAHSYDKAPNIGRARSTCSREYKVIALSRVDFVQNERLELSTICNGVVFGQDSSVVFGRILS